MTLAGGGLPWSDAELVISNCGGLLFEEVKNALDSASEEGSEIMIASNAVTPPPREWPHITSPYSGNSSKEAAMVAMTLPPAPSSNLFADA